VLVVVVAERWGLHVALTRMRVFGKRIDPDLARRFAAARQIERLMHQATVPGAKLSTVFETAVNAYASLGFTDEWHKLHQGGTIGYQPREIVASPGDDDEIESGMAFAWNPSVAGAKVEDTLLLTGAGGREVVTRDGWPVDAAGDPTIWMSGD
jgi:Xaa-Pro aminopeptidase